MNLILIKNSYGLLTKKEQAVAELAVKIMEPEKLRLFACAKMAWWDPNNQQLVTNARLSDE